MKSTGKSCYNKGGKVKSASKKEDKKEGKMHLATGGAAHKVHGTTAKARLDKKSRGGKKATTGSPLSGAMPSDANNEGGGIKNPGKFKLGSENN